MFPVRRIEVDRPQPPADVSSHAEGPADLAPIRLGGDARLQPGELELLTLTLAPTLTLTSTPAAR